MSYLKTGDIANECNKSKVESYRTKYDQTQFDFYTPKALDANTLPDGSRENFEGDYEQMYKDLAKYAKDGELNKQEITY